MKNRVIKTPALLFTSVSAIIGSGWLFSAYYSATLAGPAALLSWIAACVAVIIIAFTFAELCAFVPVTGASIRVPLYTHGVFVSYVFSWMTWMYYLAFAAVEVQAMIQYASYFWPSLVYANGGLTHLGYAMATVLMFLVTLINLYSLRWLLKCNNFLTILKLVIPVVIVAAILIAQYPKTHNSISHMTFAPMGIKGILAAITSGGIIFAYNGFKQAAEMAGEAVNPHRSLPIAIVGSVVLCMIVFLLLQYAFLASMGSNAHLLDWQNMKLSGINSPFALVLEQEKLHGLMPVLYLGAIIGPFAASLMYFSGVIRSLYAMGKNNIVPSFFSSVNQKGIPIRSAIVNFFLAMALFAPFPGWDAMASFLTSLVTLTYILAPVCLITLRHHLPDHPRYFKLPFVKTWCWVAFYLCALLFYWSGWEILIKFYYSFLIGLVILLSYRLYRGESLIKLDWSTSYWIWAYFIGMTIVGYCGSFGGHNYLSFGWDFVAIAGVCSVSLWLAVRFSTPTPQLEQGINHLMANP